MTQYISCPLCQTHNNKFMYNLICGSEETNDPASTEKKMDGGKIYKCLNCNFIFKDINSLQLNLSDYYKNLESDYYDELSAENRKREHSLMIDLITKHYKNGRVLDIGCGVGTFLGRLTGVWEKWGIEPAESTLSILEDKDIRGFSKEFMEVELPENYFNVVTMFDVMEHLTDPIKNLEKIKTILAKDGIVIISTPNVESLMAKISGKYWRHFGPIVHVGFYSPIILGSKLKNLGFEIITSKKYDYNNSFKKAFFNLVNKTTMFIVKTIIISTNLITEKLFNFKLLDRIPSFNRVLQLPWFYDFFCILAINKDKKGGSR